MKMVAHQAVVVKAKPEASPVALDQAEERVPVLVVGENRLAIVAAVHQVVAGFAGPLVAARDA
jgi:hypothetical protein